MAKTRNTHYQIEKSIIHYLPLPIFLGILLFFKLSGSYLEYCISAISALALAILAFRKILFVKIILLFFIAFFLGFGSANLQVISLTKPNYTEAKEIWLYGDVEEIERKNSQYRFLLSNLYSKNNSDLPQNIRVKSRFIPENLNIGDRIVVKTTILKPPNATVPNSFDYSEFAYFNNIHAIGYALNKPKIFRHKDLNNVNWLRNKIYHQVRAQTQQPVAGVISSLMIGKKTDITDEIFTTMQNTGTAHLLAVSGLHMATVVAFIYFLTKLFFYGSATFMNKYDIRKFAALLAILFSFMFLQITAAPVSAQRAFIMSALFLLSIVLERKPTMLRPISIAAIFIMMSNPYSIFMASFQMSFMACYVLIFLFNGPLRKLKNDSEKELLWKIKDYIIAIIISTFSVSIALIPFIIFHFNNISIYSVLGNVFAVPLTDFIIMPTIVIVLLLMPAGLESFFVQLAGFFISILLKFLTFISTLPFSNLYIPQINGTAFVAFAISLWLLCVTKGRVKYLFMVSAIIPVFFFKQTLPDVLISENNELIAFKVDDTYYYNTLVKQKFIRKCWQDYLGNPNYKHLRDAPFDLTESLAVSADDLQSFGAHALWFEDGYNNPPTKITKVSDYKLNLLEKALTVPVNKLRD